MAAEQLRERLDKLMDEQDELSRKLVIAQKRGNTAVLNRYDTVCKEVDDILLRLKIAPDSTDAEWHERMEAMEYAVVADGAEENTMLQMQEFESHLHAAHLHDRIQKLREQNPKLQEFFQRLLDKKLTDREAETIMWVNIAEGKFSAEHYLDMFENTLKTSE
eukprot:TRINITY_DN69422_c0_g1_i1.p1 TRINITY_DN69422_c0_g1~~TRINITY_DN69422_c0_g1_i1.p1  ORF type:complete len:162 (+),score=47.46 TRINITY_DN69422_c0_g1_i1:67-552(+)